MRGLSTRDQNLDAQVDALTDAGAEKLFEEKQSGKSRKRPELEKMLEQLRTGDVVVVTKYDRLARSLPDLLSIVATIRDKGAGFKSLGEDIDTRTPSGRLIFHVFASIAEFERERIVERTHEGLTAARKRGRVGGRPKALPPEAVEQVRKMRDKECKPIAEIARAFKVSRSTIYRV